MALNDQDIINGGTTPTVAINEKQAQKDKKRPNKPASTAENLRAQPPSKAESVHPKTHYHGLTPTNIPSSPWKTPPNTPSLQLHGRLSPPRQQSRNALVEKLANLDWRSTARHDGHLHPQHGAGVLSTISKRLNASTASASSSKPGKRPAPPAGVRPPPRYISTLQQQFNSTLRNFRDFEKTPRPPAPMPAPTTMKNSAHPTRRHNSKTFIPSEQIAGEVAPPVYQTNQQVQANKTTSSLLTNRPAA